MQPLPANSPQSMRMKAAVIRAVLLVAVVLPWDQAQAQPGQTAERVPPAAGQIIVLDHAVAVVNRHVVLASDIDDEIRIAVLDPALGREVELSPKRALDQIISRALIEQQIRREEEQAAEPAKAEVDKRLNEIRRNLPNCLHRNCTTEEGWSSYLAERGLNPERVASYLRYRLQILSFIEHRFRSGIQIPPEDVQAYYQKTFLPQFTDGETAPTLEQVAARIEEILLEERVNALFEDWLENLRKQGDVEILDKSFVEPIAAPHAGEAKP